LFTPIPAYVQIDPDDLAPNLEEPVSTKNFRHFSLGLLIPRLSSTTAPHHPPFNLLQMKFEAPSEADMELEKALSPSDRYLNNDETKPAAAAVSEGESEGDDLVRLSNLLVNMHLLTKQMNCSPSSC
jgi:hypothetical protein